MHTLMSVQDYAQQIAEAIATVLKIDIEIADENLIRVAGTGHYRSGVGHSMNREGFIYREVLRSGKQLTIEEPGNNPLCKPCIHRSNCPEKFEVTSPINIEGRTVGVIGLLCFDEQDAKVVKANQDSYRKFLNKMAETISFKLQEKEYINGVLSSNKYLHSIIDCLEEGLITIDKEGVVEHINPVAQAFLTSVVSKGTHISALFNKKTVTDILLVAQNGEEILDHEVSVQTGTNLRLILRARPIMNGSGIMGVVLTMRPLEEISRMVNRFSSSEIGCTPEDLLGVSKDIQSVRERVKMVASSHSTVLIRGESGTGKELVARAIHNLSPRRQNPFVAINCSAIPENLLESELFGYEEGSFSGARKGGKPGKIELANKGTLFLDEIGDMPLFLQAKILRVLQERQVERVGAVTPNSVDVRVLAATHRNLEDMITQGEFRADLYYRINVIPIVIPPLRKRKQDLDILVKHFIQVYNEVMSKSISGASNEFFDRLLQYSWPGNVRELQNVIEYAMNLVKGSVLQEESLPNKLRHIEEKTSIYNLESIEKEVIQQCLEEYGTTVQGKEKAAKALGIGIATLYRKLARNGLS